MSHQTEMGHTNGEANHRLHTYGHCLQLLQQLGVIHWFDSLPSSMGDATGLEQAVVVKHAAQVRAFDAGVHILGHVAVESFRIVLQHLKEAQCFVPILNVLRRQTG